MPSSSKRNTLLERKIQSFFRKTYCHIHATGELQTLNILTERYAEVVSILTVGPLGACDIISRPPSANKLRSLASYFCLGGVEKEMSHSQDSAFPILDISATDLRSRYFHPRYDADLQTFQAFNNDEKSWKDFIARTTKDDWKTNALNAAECLHNTGTALELVGRSEEAEKWWNMSDELQRYYGV
ncbi:hypothetical protein LTR27_004969 [Elasticomyces elasticus]|nr:hypothetical protein LTR27_004969 [Elasticomyces elasticus]